MITRRALNVGLLSTITAIATACNRNTIGQAYPQGRIEGYAKAFDKLVHPEAEIRQLASGFKWTEGPSWDRRRGRLYFSDIPNNRIHSWSRSTGLMTFLDVAGRDDETPDENAAPGTNGLWYIEEDDGLLICNQNARSIDRLNMSTQARSAVVKSFDGKPLNSPNDLVRATDGTIYFTDPPYGLKDRENLAGMEQRHFGVYRFTPSGEMSIISQGFTRPNGIALSPDESTLYVSQSDPKKPIIKAFALNIAGLPSGERLFADLSYLMDEKSPGLPDGMAVDIAGNLFATGPGGVVIFAPDGTRLGRIFTGRPTANCAFGEDGSTLFMTANDTLLSIATLTRGLAWHEA